MAPGRKPGSLLIRTRVLLLLVVVGVPFLAIQVYEGTLAYRRALADAEEQVLVASASAATSLQQFFAVVRRATGGLATRRGPELLDTRRCSALVEPYREVLPFLVNFVVVDAGGTLVCAANPDPDGAPVTVEDRYWFQTVRDTRAFTVGQPIIGRIADEWVVALASPILAGDGAFLGSAMATVGLVSFQDLLEGVDLPPDEILTVATDDGVVLARSEDAETWVGRRLPHRESDVDAAGSNRFITRTLDASGVSRLWGRVDLPEAHLRVFVGAPEDRVYGGPLAETRRRILLTALALALVAGVAVFLFRGISRSLVTLAEGIRVVDRGQAVRVPGGAPPEVSTVVERLNSTLEARERAEASERRAKDRLHAILENAAFGIAVLTPGGRFLDVNPALVSILGYESAEELIAAGPEALYPDPERRAKLIRAHAGTDVIRNVETEWLRKDGGGVRVRLNGTVILTEDGQRAFEVIAEDITERRAQEELALHRRRMEAVGSLAGGVAHEFNNILTVLGLNWELMREALPDDDSLQEEAAEIAMAIHRARALTGKLLAFSRKGVAQPRVLDLNATVRGLLETVRSILPQTVLLEVDLAPGVGRVLSDPAHVEQILVNLALNAQDAMADHGLIRVTTACRAAFPEGADETSERPEDDPRWYSVLSVADDGPGMDAAVRDRVFEPFFTTKPPGEGTGLGLPMVYGVTTDAGGHVRVQTEPGAGCVFEIWLPVADGEGEAESGETPPHGAGETILIVHEEAPIRALVRKFLEPLGYRILEARVPGQARSLVKRRGQPVDLAIVEGGPLTESGDLVVDVLRGEGPDLPVLHLGSEPEGPGRTPSPDLYVRVPFSAAVLAATVRRILDGPAARA